jgi:hypothetical protein
MKALAPGPNPELQRAKERIMYVFARLSAAGMILFVSALLLISCAEKKEGKLQVTEEAFTIRQDKENSWVIDARGRIKNVGEVDVKNVVVTGRCTSCGEAVINGRWFVSDYEKMEHQKDTISYLVPGAEEEFSFQEVAFMTGFDTEAATQKPEGLKIEILSYETVQK